MRSTTRRHAAGWSGSSETTGERNGMLNVMRELWAFMRERKKLWLLPIVAILVLSGALLVAVQGSALAPFIYSIF